MIFNTELYFKNIAIANNWGFSYGRKDYQNIYDITTAIKDKIANEEKEIALYCQELNQDVISNSVTLELLLAKKSDFKESSYEVRNQQSIYPLKKEMKSKIIELIDCESDITRCILYDRINEFDSNLDGVLANMTIRYYD